MNRHAIPGDLKLRGDRVINNLRPSQRQQSVFGDDLDPNVAAAAHCAQRREKARANGTLGDAFGIPAYTAIEQTVAAFGGISEFLPGPDDHTVHRGLPAGRITDDSEQALWTWLSWFA